MSEIESVVNNKESCGVEQAVITDEENHCAAVQTRAMKVKDGKPQKPLKVTAIHGLDIGPGQLIEQQKTDQTLKKYWELAENPVENGKAQFFVKNEILYRKYIGKHDGDGIIQLVVPESLREKVVSLTHDTLLSGHRGSTKTLNRVLQEFYWPGINNFVLRYVSSCDLCQRNVSDGTVGKAPLSSLPVIGTPLSVVCIDLIGSLSPPSDGNRWILTIIDMCPRFPECIPLRDISSSSVAEALLGVFSRVGKADRIHSDRGSQFTSEMMQELYRLLSVKQSTTSRHHAMGNGLCENMNRTVKNLPNKVVSERPQDWSRYITPLMFAVRDTPQDSTGFTPFELLFGHRVRTPLTLLKHLWTSEKEDTEVKTTYQYVLDLRERIEETCQLAQEEIAKVQKRNQTYYNRRARKRRLNIGDSVLLLLLTENNKLTLASRGPHKVVEKVGEVDYKTRVTRDKIKTYHINMLKEYHQRKEQSIENDDESGNISESEVSKDGHIIEQVAAIACANDDGITENNEFEIEDDKELLPLYSVKHNENVNDVVINPDLSSEQQNEVSSLLRK